ncbi:MAG: hypothetical protein K2J77_07450 [Oscillospiraceae bacterium]|nr:hypothetical protein [Oscillospiraceae bacterium]
MATNITINDNQGRTLAITSGNNTIDYGNDPRGARIFRVEAPYTLSHPLRSNPDYYTPGSANINGDVVDGKPIMVVEHQGDNVEIHIRG